MKNENTLRGEPATYQTTKLPAFALGNPLSEALPTLLDLKDQPNALMKRPIGDFKSHHDMLNGFMQLSTLGDINFPRPESSLLYLRVMSMLHNTYSKRNPLDPATQRKLYSIDEGLLHFYSAMPIQVEATTVVAWSGMGKTTLVRSILSLFPQVIAHTKYGDADFIQKQVVYLSVDAPIGASAKGLLLNIAAALDAALGLEGVRSYVHQLDGASSVESKKVLITRALASHFVGVLHIDDVQRLAEGSKTLRAQVVATIIGMANTIGSALILSGTPAAMDVLTANFEAVRRSVRRGSATITAPLTAADPFFVKLIEFLFRHQIAQPQVVPDDRMRRKLLTLTAGIPGVLTALYVATQVTALTTEVPLSEGLFIDVMASQFAMLRPAIRKLNQARKKGVLAWDAQADDLVRRHMNAVATKAPGSDRQAGDDDEEAFA